MSITVRKLTPHDAEQYQMCRLDALRDAPSAFASSYEEEALFTIESVRERFANHPSDSAFFGAFDKDGTDERLIGLTGIFREKREKRLHKMTIVSVFVRPEYRGQQVGVKLMQAAITHARTVEGVERIELSVESSNAPAKALYSSLGFQTWGTEPDFSSIDGVHYDEDCMSLAL